MENRPFLPGRGRRGWGDAPGAGNYGEKWHQKLDYIEQPKNPRQPKELRIVGGVFTLNQHYVRFEKKTGGFTGYYEVCPDFDAITGEFRTGKDCVCPICRDFSDSELPEEIRMFGSFRYYFDAFDLSAIKSGSTSGVFGVVWANKYGKNDIIKVSDTLDGYSVDDLERGCSVFYYFDGKAKDAKERQSFTRGEPLVVKYSKQKNLYGVQYNGNVYTGEPTPFDEIVEVKAADKIVADLKRVKLYDKLEAYLASTNKSFSVPNPGDSQGAPSAPPPDPAPQQAPPQQEAASSGWDDFGGGDSAPVETPPVETPPVETAAAAPANSDFDFGDDTGAAPATTPSEPTSTASPESLDGDFFGDDSGGGNGATATTDDSSGFGDWDDNSEEQKASAPAEAPAAAPAPTDTASIADDFGDDW